MIKNRNISLNDFIVQRKGNIVSDMDGEKVMLNVEKGKYYNLGAIGGEIWSLLELPITANQLVETLRTIYEVEQVECEKQVQSFLDLLLENELIEVAGNGN